MGPCGGLGGIETEKLFNRALPCRFQPQERQGNRAVVSSRLVANVDVLWKRACPRTKRASERTRQCIHRTLVDPMSPPTVRPSRQTFRYVGVGKMPTGRLRREEGKKDSPSGPGPTYTCARFPLFQGLLVCFFFCFCSTRQGARDRLW